ncbi:MAG: penicillin-binding protein 1A [Sphingomonadales bacterium]
MNENYKFKEEMNTLPILKNKKGRWGKIFTLIIGLVFIGVISTLIATFLILSHYGRGLPDFLALRDYEPPIVTRIHAGDGSLVTEYARQQRLFVPYGVIPPKLLQAFLAAEDKNFFNHTGLDYFGIIRALGTNFKNFGTNRKLVGASTITQQVARNFLLTFDQKLERKIKEMILTIRIEKAFTKEEILELYLNEIYLGNGAYGIAAASLNYFDKALDQLTLEEMAYLAALPKAPSNYHPIRQKNRAIGRRNWVIHRMAVNGYIGEIEALEAQKKDLITKRRVRAELFKAEYYAEEVRRELYNVHGNKNLYEGGLSVKTALEPSLQAIAEKALREGLENYDRRHGWRGPIKKLKTSGDWPDELGSINQPLGFDNWQLALVLETRAEGAIIGFEGETYGFIPLKEVIWARKWLEGERIGQKIDDITSVIIPGDVVVVEALSDDMQNVIIENFYNELGENLVEVPQFGLRQIPEIEGAIVAMDPHTGRVLAMVGGFDFALSEYNRATQAERQPGSAFKPFIYAAALEAGFTPSSLVLDAPFVMEQGAGQPLWKPSNSSNKYYGPSTLRLGMEKSRNLMTVRIAQYLGMDKVVNIANRFGVGKNVKPTLSMSLGAGEVSLLKLTAAYGMLVNGGKKITPTLIDRIQDRHGKSIFKHDERDCPGCKQASWLKQKEPNIQDSREQVIDPRVAYQVVSLLEGVVRTGTGRRIGTLKLPLAGKTGTTNESFDTWFIGFSPDLVVGVFVGFDRPRSLGYNEEGSSVGAPIFRQFMKDAFKRQPVIPFRVPSGIRLIRVNAETGLPAKPEDKNIILEAFLPGFGPINELLVLDGLNGFLKSNGKVKRGTGGLY